MDIAPTILDLAQVKGNWSFDGESVKNQLFSKNDMNFRKYVLVEYVGEANNETIDQECHLGYDSNLSVSVFLYYNKYLL